MEILWLMIGEYTMKINIVIDYDYADKRIQALKKTKKLIDKEINDFIKERETPPPIEGYGISEKIRKLFED